MNILKNLFYNKHKVAASRSHQDWPWAGWGFAGAFIALVLPCLGLPIAAVGGAPQWKGYLLALLMVGCPVMGWRMGVRIGYRRNFGTGSK